MHSTYRGLRQLLPQSGEGLSSQQLGRLRESVHRRMTPIEAESWDRALQSLGSIARVVAPIAAPIAASVIPGGALLAPIVSQLVNTATGGAQPMSRTPAPPRAPIQAASTLAGQPGAAA